MSRVRVICRVEEGSSVGEGYAFPGPIGRRAHPAVVCDPSLRDGMVCDPVGRVGPQAEWPLAAVRLALGGGWYRDAVIPD